MKRMTKIQQGFSLIEVSILITVMAILSTSMLPSLIATHKEKLAEKTLRDLFALQEAAEAYHHQHGTWPAEESSCTAPASNKGMQVLVAQGFLSQPLKEPLSQRPYQFGYIDNGDGCALRLYMPEDDKISAAWPHFKQTLNTFGRANCADSNNASACYFSIRPPDLSDMLRKEVDETLKPRLDDVADLWAEQVRKQKEKDQAKEDEADTYEIRMLPGDAQVCAAGYRAKELQKQNFHAGHRVSLDLAHGNGAMCPPIPKGWQGYTCYLHCEKR